MRLDVDMVRSAVVAWKKGGLEDLLGCLTGAYYERPGGPAWLPDWSILRRFAPSIAPCSA
eukprot:365214-Chlamydomonas_euryale.AAC.23